MSIELWIAERQHKASMPNCQDGANKESSMHVIHLNHKIYNTPEYSQIALSSNHKMENWGNMRILQLTRKSEKMCSIGNGETHPKYLCQIEPSVRTYQAVQFIFVKPLEQFLSQTNLKNGIKATSLSSNQGKQWKYQTSVFVLWKKETNCINHSDSNISLESGFLKCLVLLLGI